MQSAKRVQTPFLKWTVQRISQNAARKFHLKFKKTDSKGLAKNYPKAGSGNDN
jgi:reverse gyrase